MQHRNKDKVVKRSLVKDLRNSRKVKKILAIHEIHNIVFSKKSKCLYKLEAQKKYPTQKVAAPDLFSVTN